MPLTVSHVTAPLRTPVYANVTGGIPDFEVPVLLVGNHPGWSLYLVEAPLWFRSRACESNFAA